MPSSKNSRWRVARYLALGAAAGALLGALFGIGLVLVYMGGSAFKNIVMSMIASSVFYAVHGAVLGSLGGLAVGLVRRKARTNAG